MVGARQHLCVCAGHAFRHTAAQRQQLNCCRVQRMKSPAAPADLLLAAPPAASCAALLCLWRHSALLLANTTHLCNLQRLHGLPCEVCVEHGAVGWFVGSLIGDKRHTQRADSVSNHQQKLNCQATDCNCPLEAGNVTQKTSAMSSQAPTARTANRTCVVAAKVAVCCCLLVALVAAAHHVKVARNHACLV